MEEHLTTVGIANVAQLKKVGALEATRSIFLAGLAKPHIMYYLCLEAAIAGRDIFSFEADEKAELRAIYKDAVQDY